MLEFCAVALDIPNTSESDSKDDALFLYLSPCKFCVHQIGICDTVKSVVTPASAKLNAVPFAGFTNEAVLAMLHDVADAIDVITASPNMLQQRQDL